MMEIAIIAWLYFAGAAASIFAIAEAMPSLVGWKVFVFLAGWPVTVPVALIAAAVSK